MAKKKTKKSTKTRAKKVAPKRKKRALKSRKPAPKKTRKLERARLLSEEVPPVPPPEPEPEEPELGDASAEDGDDTIEPPDEEKTGAN